MLGRGSLFFAVALFTFTNLAFAQNLTLNQSFLSAAAQYAQCKTNFTVAYIGKIAAVVPSLSGLGQYSTAIQAGTSQLSAIAGAGNVALFRNYLSGNYDQQLNNIARNVSAQIRAANLSRNQTSQLRIQYNSTLATYMSCRLIAAKNVALKELGMYNSSIASYQKEAASLSQQGLNTSALSTLLQGAATQIIAPIAAAVSQSTNASQISSALSRYCLFDGCRNGTNFHLAARFELQKLTAELSYLQTNGNVPASSLATAQSYLNTAASILQTVGSAVYVNGQSSAIFGNLSAATKSMQQARQQQALTKAKLQAANVIATYANTIIRDRASIAQLASQGIPTAGLNQTLANATSAVIVPLQNALNSSANLTQLNSAFKARCLENGCANGTNFNLAAKLKLGQAQAELTYLAQKASASANVIVNATALSAAQAHLANASTLIGSTGGAQLTNGLVSRITTESNGFAVAVKNAYTVVKKPAATAVPRTTVAPTATTGSPKPAPNTVTSTGPAPTPPIAPGRNASSTPLPIKTNGTAGGITSVGPVSGPKTSSATGQAANVSVSR
jgi:hypothetical protein